MHPLQWGLSWLQLLWAFLCKSLDMNPTNLEYLSAPLARFSIMASFGKFWAPWRTSWRLRRRSRAAESGTRCSGDGPPRPWWSAAHASCWKKCARHYYFCVERLKKIFPWHQSNCEQSKSPISPPNDLSKVLQYACRQLTNYWHGEWTNTDYLQHPLVC